MGEYIKKDKLIKAFYDEMQSMKNTDRSEAADKVFGILMRYVNSFEAADVQPVDRWISCKDKMPDDNEIVLFCYVSDNGVKSVHYGYHQTIKGVGSSWAKPSGGWQYADDDVTHWQPLPKPPKDGEQNENH